MCGCILFTNIKQMLHATGRQIEKHRRNNTPCLTALNIRSNKLLRIFSYCTMDVKNIFFEVIVNF